MMLFALLLVAAVPGPPDITVEIAPDQPAPHIFVGDPLILEFRADRDCTVTVEAEITPEFGGDKLVAPLGDIRLSAHSPQWRTIDAAPHIRGRYTLTTRVLHPTGIPETAGVFCRIDRPGPESAPLPVCAVVADMTPAQRLALDTAGVRAVRVNVGSQTDFKKVDAALESRFQVMVRLTNPAVVAAAAQTWHDRVYCWQCEASTPGDALQMALALRAGGARSPIALVVPDPAAVTTLLEAGAGKVADALALDPATNGNALREARDAAERAGYERLEIQACLPRQNSQKSSGSLLARQGLELVAAGASALDFDAALVADRQLGPAFVYLDTIAHRLSNAAYVGRLPLEAATVAHVFKTRDRWVITAWAETGEADAIVPVEGAIGLELYDGRNNPLPLPPIQEGAMTMKTGPEPIFFTGKGGSILHDTALAAAKQEAAAVCADEELTKAIAKEAVDVVKKFAGDAACERVDFLNLLAVFPYLEKQWHAGPLRRSVAAPALAALSRLARAVCIAEHERGEPFVEPLQGMLAACGQYQSLYLTGSAGPEDAHERPDWLLAEVSRLMDEAETLAADGRAIEAGAVAALAEARAQALEIAAKAKPLSTPEPPPIAEEKKEEPPTETKDTEKKKGS